MNMYVPLMLGWAAWLVCVCVCLCHVIYDGSLHVAANDNGRQLF